MQLSWECEEQLYRKKVEDADDIRLSARLFQKCLPDKKQFCANIQPGHARAKQCLEENRKKLSQGKTCRQRLVIYHSQMRLSCRWRRG